MTFNDNAQLDTSQVQSGGGSGGGGMAPGGIAVGGGIGGLILMILMVLFGGNLTGSDPNSGGSGLPYDPNDTSQIDSGNAGAAGGSDPVQQAIDQCKTGADANKDDTCRVVGTVNSVQYYWAQYLPKYGKQYTKAPTVMFRGSTSSGCGTASSAMGPFYCPLDKKVYLDTGFFGELTSKYGANGGPLAQEYVLAHEYGHHVQDILGLLGRAQQDQQGADSASVRTELQADCFAGMWVKDATTTKDANGNTLLKSVTQQDITDALSAAAAVGDDRIQQKAQGRVTPETWTHGSAKARQYWFTQGYTTGDINKCNTFDATDLNQ
ncbi:hypothetical protein G9U51_03690 [Calidifontibacter sp. DB0510]|uniref:Neutral zinc metallopeptidase n=1 Tax=Metallococcus carri TaxID=1656884 RepID=A0A967EDN1_9MICO|nr:neutral zinc metallopeptidase [Metallococcus carri]NHN54886.1 hypothetical protein [Metallococcus carri]NOP37231.1 hypothetical protein [Calidifontibacter sp. DB2511S]